MRARKWLSLVALVALLVTCSGRASPEGQPPETPLAVSAPASVISAPTTPVTSPEAPWNLASELQSLRPVTPRAASEHLAQPSDGQVLANEAAKPYPMLGPGLTFKPGATLVEQLVAHGFDAPTVYFAMVKRPPGYDPDGGDWEYLVAGPDGRIEERGRLPLCRRCHADAPHDHLFGAAR